MAIASLSPRLQTTVIVAVLILGCREPSTRASVPRSAEPVPVEISPVAEPASTMAPEPTNRPLTESKPATRNISEDEIVGVLIDSNFQGATPEGAKARLAPVGSVTVSRPVDTTTEVRAAAAQAQFLVSYIRDGRGGWQFSYAKLTRDVVTADGAKASYDRFASLLRGRFGKPVWTQDGSPPMVGWNAGDPMEVSLLQHEDEPDKFVVEIMLAEPQGESED
jgi:hypothetical protein